MTDSTPATFDPPIDLAHVVDVAIDLIDHFIACFEGRSTSTSAIRKLRSDQRLPEDLSKAIGAACLHKFLTDAGIADPDLPDPTELLAIIKSQLEAEPEVFWEECWEVREVLARVETVRRSYRWGRFESANFAIASDQEEAERLLDAFAQFCWSNRHTEFEPEISPVKSPLHSLFQYLNHSPKKVGRK